MVYNSTTIDMSRTDAGDLIQVREFGKMAIHSVGTGTGNGTIEVSNNGIDWVENDSTTTNIDLTIPIILDSFPWEFIRFVPIGTGIGTLTMLISIKQ